MLLSPKLNLFHLHNKTQKMFCNTEDILTFRGITQGSVELPGYLVIIL